MTVHLQRCARCFVGNNVLGGLHVKGLRPKGEEMIRVSVCCKGVKRASDLPTTAGGHATSAVHVVCTTAACASSVLLAVSSFKGMHHAHA